MDFTTNIAESDFRYTQGREFAVSRLVESSALDISKSQLLIAQSENRNYPLGNRARDGSTARSNQESEQPRQRKAYAKY